MKKYKVALIAVGVILAGLLAWKLVPKNPYHVSAIEPDSYLYHITDGKGGGIYLLGSMHFGVKPIKFDGKLREVYSRCPTLLVEMRWGVSNQKITEQVMKQNPISEIQDPAFWNVFEALDKNYEFINQNLMAYNVQCLFGMAEAEINHEIGLVQEHGVDMTIQRKALRDGKNMVEIEDAARRTRMMEQQAETMLPLSYLEQIVDKEATIAATVDMVNLYNSGAFEAHMAMPESSFLYDETIEIPKELFKTPEEKVLWEHFRKEIVLDRTQFMVQIMREHMEGDDTLTVIGLEHVYGGGGLLAEFEKGGDTVTRVE